MAPRGSKTNLLLAVVVGLLLIVAVSAGSRKPNKKGEHDVGHHHKKAPLRSGLSSSYYSQSCPNLKSTVKNIVKNLVKKDDTLPAAWIRVLFHDCFVRGCDASVLINNTDPNTELNGLPNANSLRGLHVLAKVKTAVEKKCPGKVSCADLLVLATRDAVRAAGGPSWKVRFGRKDGFVSNASEANAALPGPFSNFSTLLQSFEANGLDANDMVVLSGIHTIGFTHCRFITSRLYNFSGSPDGIDPTLNKKYARELQKQCPQGGPDSRVLMDPSKGGQTFDSNHYRNVLENRGLFASDQALISNPLGLFIVNREATSPKVPFFEDFALAMEKMIEINVLTGNEGEIRKKCSNFNSH